MEGFKSFKPEKKKPITRENSIENLPETVVEKGLGRKQGYNFEEIEELENPIKELVWMLKKDIVAGKYDVMIGDDASGRIPTLALRKIFMSMIRESKPNLKAVKDREKLKTFFVDGGKRQNEKELFKYFKKIKPDIKKKVLFVTDYIYSGESILKVARAFDKAGISFDVATVVANDGSRWKESKEVFISGYKKPLEAKGHSLLIGNFTSHEPKIYNKPDLSGLKHVGAQPGSGDNKVYKTVAHAEPRRNDLEKKDWKHYVDFWHEEKEPGVLKSEHVKELTESLERSREDVDLLANRVLDNIDMEEKALKKESKIHYEWGK